MSEVEEIIITEGKYPLSIKQGTTVREAFEWRDSEDNLIDITGFGFTLRVFEPGNTTPVLILTDQNGGFIFPDPTLADGEIYFTPAQTQALSGEYTYDVLYTEPDSDVFPLIESEIMVRP